MNPQLNDCWMEPWLPRLRSAAFQTSVLELGCDHGRDTAWLAQRGFDAVATGISAEALAQCATAVPSASHWKTWIDYSLAGIGKS